MCYREQTGTLSITPERWGRGEGGSRSNSVRIVFFKTENYKMEQRINDSYCTLVVLCSYSPNLYVFNCLFKISQFAFQKKTGDNKVKGR